MAGKRGRKPGFTMTDSHRDKIKGSNILNALIEHTEGKREMSSSQVTAGLGLLGFAFPKMTESMVKGAGENGEHSVEFRFKFE